METSGITKLVFANEHDYRAARDVNLEMLGAEGWKPKPDLEMLVTNSRIEKLKAKLNDKGIAYRAETNV